MYLGKDNSIMGLLDECNYLTFKESSRLDKNVDLIPVVENTDLGMNLVDYEDLRSFSEDNNLLYDEAITKIAEANSIEPSSIGVTIYDYTLLETPFLVCEIPNIVIKPIRESDEVYKGICKLIDEVYETKDYELLDEFHPSFSKYVKYASLGALAGGAYGNKNNIKKFYHDYKTLPKGTKEVPIYSKDGDKKQIGTKKIDLNQQRRDALDDDMDHIINDPYKLSRYSGTGMAVGLGLAVATDLINDRNAKKADIAKQASGLSRWLNRNKNKQGGKWKTIKSKVANVLQKLTDKLDNQL